MFQRAMASAIKAQWPDCRIYTDPVKQYLAPPCFVILPAEAEHRTEWGQNRADRYSYAVYYYPVEGQKQEETDRIGTALCQTLELIRYGELGYWAQGLQYRMVDHALVLTVSYTCRYRFTEDIELMETMRHTILMGDDKNGK